MFVIGMFYRCTHCGQPFRSEDARPRCPRCLRITTVVPVGAPRGAERLAGRKGEPVDSPHAPRVERGADGGAGRDGAGRPGARAEPPPGSLWLGLVVLGTTALAWAGTDVDRAMGAQRTALLATFGGLAGAGSGLLVWGLWCWLRGRLPPD